MTSPRTLRNLIVNLSLVALCLVPLLAQQMTTIEGQIIGTDGNPLPGAELKFERTDVKAEYSIKTDKDGKFKYATLPKGIYNVELLVDGVSIGRQEGIPTDPGHPIPLNINLQAAAAAQAAQGGQEAPAAEEVKPSPEQIEALRKAKEDNDAIAKKNEDLNLAFNTGMEAMKGKQWQVAIDNFTKATDVDPTQHVVFAQLGEAYKERGSTQRDPARQQDFERSVQAYAKAVQLKPEDPAYHNNYALALGRAKKVQEAQAEIAKATELDKANAARYQRNLARMLFDTGQNDAAEAAFRKAIEMDPKDADAHYQLGLVLVGKATIAADGKMTAPPGTAEEFQQYLKLAPNGPEAEGAKGMLQALGGTVQTTIKQ